MSGAVPDGLRLLMTTDAVGGVWTYALDLARGLSGSGVATTLAVLGPAPYDVQAAAAAAIPGLTLRITGLPLDWLAEDEAAVLDAGAAIAAMARAERVELVHLNGPALAAAGGFPVPVLGACHSLPRDLVVGGQEGAMPEDFRWRTALLARGYRAAAALVAPSRAFARATAEAHGLRAPPLVIRNGRAPAAAATSALTPENAVFTAGRLWDPAKNLAMLDRAAARLTVPVLAAGPLAGPSGDRIEPRHLRPLGRIDAAAIAERLAARPIYAAPALYEPFGLAVLEAAQAGCALLLSDIPTFRELWGDAAVFVPAEDDAAAAAAVAALLDDPARRAALGEPRRRRAGDYGIGVMTAAMRGLYQKLRDGRGEAAA